MTRKHKKVSRRFSPCSDPGSRTCDWTLLSCSCLLWTVSSLFAITRYTVSWMTLGFWEALTLCDNLRSFHLYMGDEEFITTRAGANLIPMMRLFPTFLLPYVSHTVRNITIALGPDEYGGLMWSWIAYWADWIGLEGHLRVFPELEEFSLIREDPCPSRTASIEAVSEWSQQYVSESLPSLHAAGKLRFPCGLPFKTFIESRKYARRSQDLYSPPPMPTFVTSALSLYQPEQGTVSVEVYRSVTICSRCISNRTQCLCLQTGWRRKRECSWVCENCCLSIS